MFQGSSDVSRLVVGRVFAMQGFSPSKISPKPPNFEVSLMSFLREDRRFSVCLSKRGDLNRLVLQIFG